MANFAIIAQREPNDDSLAIAVDAILSEHFPGYISESDAGLFVFSTDMLPEEISTYFEHLELELSDTLLILELGRRAIQLASGSDFFRELETRLGST